MIVMIAKMMIAKMMIDSRELAAFALFLQEYIDDSIYTVVNDRFEKRVNVHRDVLEEPESMKKVFKLWCEIRSAKEHDGDCIGQPCCCYKCVAERFYERAEKLLSIYSQE